MNNAENSSGAEPVYVDQVLAASGGGTMILTFLSPVWRGIGQPPEMVPTVAVAMTEERLRDMLKTIERHFQTSSPPAPQPAEMMN